MEKETHMPSSETWKKKRTNKKHSSYYVVQQLLIIFVAFKDVSFSFQLPLHYFATSHRDSKST